MKTSLDLCDVCFDLAEYGCHGVSDGAIFSINYCYRCYVDQSFSIKKGDK